MIELASIPTELRDLAAEFADTLTRRIQKIIPTKVEFSTLALARGDERFVGVGYVVDGQVQTMPLTIGGVHRLDLLLKLHCRWDRCRGFLALS